MSRKSRAGSTSTLRQLKGWKKLQYILDYYKFPLLLAAAALYIIIWLTMRNLTQKDVVLYVGLVNAAPSEELILKLSDGYLEETGFPKSDNSVYLYRNLFLSADETSEYHPYSYATKMKILGAINANQLDVVLMNQEAFDAFSQNGYLADLQELLNSPEAGADGRSLFKAVKGSLCTNVRIEEDNSVDVLLGNETEYHSVTTKGSFGLNLTDASALVGNAGLSGTVFLGIIKNSTRKKEAVQYLDYLIRYH